MRKPNRPGSVFVCGFGPAGRRYVPIGGADGDNPSHTDRLSWPLTARNVPRQADAPPFGADPAQAQGPRRSTGVGLPPDR